MEHLPRPASGASQEPETVACVCQTESDDGKPYVLPPTSDTRENLPFWQYERHHRSPKQELESFFQTWLFAGLINEIHGDLCSANDFVRAAADDTSQVVTTSQLLGIIDIWIQKVHSGDLRPSYDHVAECLRLTHESLRAAGPTFDLTLMLSIAATGELLEYAANKAFHIGNFVEEYKCPASWRILFNESLWEASMREAGWCPSQITLLFQGCFSVQSLYFFIWLSQSDAPSRHLRCDEQKCSAYQNSLGKYETRHVATDCICEHLSTDVIAIDGILKKGQPPLLRIVPGQTLAELAVKILDSKPTSRYVALSHVWADGLGNPTADSLPRCQLLQLYGLLQHQDLATDAGDAQGDLLLWCDTLCCPVEPQEAKDRALTYMRKTYEDAIHVLVLDTSLRLHDSATLSPEELCVRIFASGWMRRLWTLQDGSLPSEKWRLWFQFLAERSGCSSEPSWSQGYCGRDHQSHSSLHSLLSRQSL